MKQSAIPRGTVAILDASVLYGMRTTDLLMTTALFGLYQARWTAKIDEEWMAAIMRNKTTTWQKVTRRCNCMHAAILDWKIQNIEQISLEKSLPDRQDNHVLKAAIAGEADWIVTFNLRDFPEEIVKYYNVSVRHPDDFLLGLGSSEQFLEAITYSMSGKRKPPLTLSEYVESVSRAGLPKLALYLKKVLA